MKINISIGIVVCAFLLYSPLYLSAQENPSKFWQGWSINVNGGASLFYGDVENYDYYKVFRDNSEWRFGFGGMLQKQLNPYFTFRGQIFYGQLSGTKRRANIWFEGDVFETSLSGKLDLINVFWGPEERKFSFYGMLGVGLVQWKTELKDFTTNEPIGGNGNVGSGINGRTLEPVLPFGFGIDYNINERWAINIEGSWRPVNSDKLDATEGGSQYDLYSYNFIGLTYKFVKRKEKPLILPSEELAVEEVMVEPLIEPVEEQVEIVQEETPVVKTLEEKLLDAEARTGLYESPWPGVEFTVQIAASKAISDPAVIEKKFGLPNQANVHHADGWYRFSMGSYIKYWRAKEYRNILVTRNDIDDAFVVAYKDGKRIMLNDLVSIDESTIQAKKMQEERPDFARAFSVQVLASQDGNIPVAAIREMYEIDLEVFKEYNSNDKTYQYSVGNFNSYQEAAKVWNKLKARGIRGAFVVGYKDGDRVEDLKTILD